MALVTPKNGDDDELYVWGYIPFGEADENGQVVPVMKKSLRPLLVTSVLGYKISHVACSPWHFTLAATPATSTSGSLEKPFLMTFGRYSDDPVLEKPFSPLFLDIPPEDEFYETKPWRTFRSVSASSDLVIKKIAASKGCDIVLMGKAFFFLFVRLVAWISVTFDQIFLSILTIFHREWQCWSQRP